MNNLFDTINPKDLNENVIRAIGYEWMLITAGSKSHYNTMTAAWGGIGYLWNLPVSYIFVRPQRFTFEYTEQYDNYSLCFFDKTYKKDLMYCGRNSGRDVNKAKETKLTAIESPNGLISFEEARLIIDCKKIYADDIKELNFLDKSVDQKVYPEKDYHRMYIGEIKSIYKRKTILK